MIKATREALVEVYGILLRANWDEPADAATPLMADAPDAGPDPAAHSHRPAYPPWRQAPEDPAAPTSTAGKKGT